MRQGNEYSPYEKPLLHSAAVLDNEPVARGVRLLRTEKPFVFRAGQCAALSTSATGPVRYYSMAGGDGDGGIFRGRLGAWFSGAVRENRLVQGCRYFLCGNSEMVVTVRDILISAGVPFERILSEIYF